MRDNASVRRRLIRLSVLAVLAITVPSARPAAEQEPPGREATSETASSTRFTAVVAAVSGSVSIHGGTVDAPRPATIGRRLRVGEIVKTGNHASATIYLAGGQLLEILGGSRVRITKDLAGDATGARRLARLSSSALKVLEQGVWILSDPEGSFLVPAMRGEDPDEGDLGIPRSRSLLSPRGEAVLEPRPTFFWMETSPPVRVVIAHADTVLWRSPPVSGSVLRYPATEESLAAGGEYEWWLEAPSTGAPLTPSSRFHVISPEVTADVSGFERTMRDLEESLPDKSLTSFLRCAYYEELRAWTPMLSAATEGWRRDVENLFAQRSIAMARKEMGLTTKGADRLLYLLASQPREEPRRGP